MADAPAPDVDVRRMVIISPRADLWLMVLSPLWSLGAGWLVSRFSTDTDLITFYGQTASASSMVVLGLIHAHFIAVIFRSHFNPDVRRLHPFAFWGVPVLLVGGMWLSPMLFGIGIVMTAFWDVYHSSMQTFGLCRIYDAKMGAPATEGRALDLWMNHAIYIGPILCGPTLPFVLGRGDVMRGTYLDFFARWCAAIVATQPTWSKLVAGAGILVVIGYIVQTWRMARRGYPVSPLKLALLTSTAIASVAASGFDLFGQALLVINLFHAVQYLALVWWLEQRNIQRVFGMEADISRRWTGLGALFLVGVYGFVVGVAPKFWQAWPQLKLAGFVLSTAVSLLHFWYDGFIWSVRRKQVT